MAELSFDPFAYGTDPAQRLLLFGPTGAASAPVVLFVGDDAVLAPDCARIGAAFAAHGFTCAVIGYRAAPAHPFPAGPEDVAAAIGWLHARLGDDEGEPARIVAVGHGNGALHLAGYVADEALHVSAHGGLAGVALLSGIYDPRRCTVDDGLSPLFGAGWRTGAAGASAAGLLSTDLPLLFTIGERDGPDRQMQAAQLVGAWGLAHAAYPPMHLVAGHDHQSAQRSIGTADRRVELLLADFVRRVAD